MDGKSPSDFIIRGLVAVSFFRPFGACAVGCILSPLRGLFRCACDALLLSLPALGVLCGFGFPSFLWTQ
jgi:hypothetical protein